MCARWVAYRCEKYKLVQLSVAATKSLTYVFRSECSPIRAHMYKCWVQYMFHADMLGHTQLLWIAKFHVTEVFLLIRGEICTTNLTIYLCMNHDV